MRAAGNPFMSSMAARTFFVRAPRASWENSRFALSMNSRRILLSSQERWVCQGRTGCRIPRIRSPRSPSRSSPLPSAARRENRPAWLAHTVYQRVREKLQREPVEDFRIDFEDGYGNRPTRKRTAMPSPPPTRLAQAMNAGELPPFIGIRVKPLTEELRHRSIRTLDIFLTELAGKTRGELPEEFRVTLPKVDAAGRGRGPGGYLLAPGTCARP